VAPIIGFLGVGTVATAVIHSLCATHGSSVRIVLSPRSHQRSDALAVRYAQCTRLGSNQEVVDAADIVVLAMRPQQMDEALAGLSFRKNQAVASFIAGSPPSAIAQMVSPAHRIAQLIPLPAIELGRGPLLICPNIPDIVDIFAPLGEAIVIDEESQTRVFSVASAFMSTYYELQNTVIDWMSSRGVPDALAARYVLSELDGLAAVGLSTPEERLGELPIEHETRGGLNERVRAHMTRAGAFAALHHALDDVYDNAELRSPEPTERNPSPHSTK
jgi:pyrroline-5-carboxylate reductase